MRKQKNVDTSCSYLRQKLTEPFLTAKFQIDDLENLYQVECNKKERGIMLLL